MQDYNDDILHSTTKATEKARDPLAKLFRVILRDINIGVKQWGQLMELYLDNPRHRIPKNGKDRSSARGNLNKELRRSYMTWKVFMKGLSFLNIKHVRIELHATWWNRRVTIHSVGLQLNRIPEEEKPVGQIPINQDLTDRLYNGLEYLEDTLSAEEYNKIVSSLCETVDAKLLSVREDISSNMTTVDPVGK
ncbi:MAG: hypothetical protein CL678_15810 [Bdellovibrionaceae bacterium]|nr:hypothetical protein [Pseudobdellovibrionaceae bacterium]